MGKTTTNLLQIAHFHPENYENLFVGNKDNRLQSFIEESVKKEAIFLKALGFGKEWKYNKNDKEANKKLLTLWKENKETISRLFIQSLIHKTKKKIDDDKQDAWNKLFDLLNSQSVWRNIAKEWKEKQASPDRLLRGIINKDSQEGKSERTVAEILGVELRQFTKIRKIEDSDKIKKIEGIINEMQFNFEKGKVTLSDREGVLDKLMTIYSGNESKSQKKSQNSQQTKMLEQVLDNILKDFSEEGKSAVVKVSPKNKKNEVTEKLIEDINTTTSKLIQAYIRTALLPEKGDANNIRTQILKAMGDAFNDPNIDKTNFKLEIESLVDGEPKLRTYYAEINNDTREYFSTVLNRMEKKISKSNISNTFSVSTLRPEQNKEITKDYKRYIKMASSLAENFLEILTREYNKKYIKSSTGQKNEALSTEQKREILFIFRDDRFKKALKNTFGENIKNYFFTGYQLNLKKIDSKSKESAYERLFWSDYVKKNFSTADKAKGEFSETLLTALLKLHKNMVSEADSSKDIQKVFQAGSLTYEKADSQKPIKLNEEIFTDIIVHVGQEKIGIQAKAFPSFSEKEFGTFYDETGSLYGDKFTRYLPRTVIANLRLYSFQENNEETNNEMNQKLFEYFGNLTRLESTIRWTEGYKGVQNNFFFFNYRLYPTSIILSQMLGNLPSYSLKRPWGNTEIPENYYIKGEDEKSKLRNLVGENSIQVYSYTPKKQNNSSQSSYMTVNNIVEHKDTLSQQISTLNLVGITIRNLDYKK